MFATSLAGGGPLEHSLVLARALTATGTTVEATCANEEVAARFAAAGAVPHVLPLERGLDFGAGIRFESLAREADVVHAQDRRCGLWTRIWPRRERDPARVYTVHGLPDPYLPIPANAGRRPGLRNQLAYRGFDAWLARRSDAVVVPSRALAIQLVQRLGFPLQRLEIIPNGIELGPPVAGGELIATISLLDPVKGLDTFLRAAAAVTEARPEARFAIFGDGPQLETLRTLARELGVAVDFRGHVPVAEALPQLRLYVLCSWFENCPMSLLEAMGAGVPTVATDVGGVPELAADVALRVPSGDPEALAGAILEALGDPERMAGLAQRARARVERDYSAESNARALLALYERLRRRNS